MKTYLDDGRIEEMPSIDRRIDDVLERYKKEEEFRPTIVPKAKFYRRAIDVSMLVACASGFAMLIFILISVSTHKEVNPCGLIIALGCIMMASLVVFVIFVTKRAIWIKKIRKMGLTVYIPFKYL